MIETFLEFEFLRNTLYTGLLVGLIAPLLGTFIVVRRLSLIADGLSHVTLSGIAFGLFLEKKIALIAISPYYMGIGFSIIGAIIIEYLRSVYQSFQEIAIPIILSVGVGLSVIFISLADGFNTDLYAYLFGSVAAVGRGDFYFIFMISIFIVLAVIFFYKELFAISFDDEYAKVSGIHAKAIHLLFIILTALAISASIRIVGVLLVSALMTLPVAASIRIAKSFKKAIFLSIVFGELAVLAGLVSGYYFEIPPGGTIVVSLALILGITLFRKSR
ncbi:metal ABC transporter permease [Salinibacillus xinjiangensis]|uniref:Iron chelate uptake ABC transporter family permease subunit n=1 Tax=Salinibacillus xinjiangensis TaxID=1229268 RepID=A0A6G1X2J0_9BACI|nr:metal ABC transporter permease [Salinibacillus xinjiangensis]MRG85139.1 iron chelate uptake ABC transporter family permease subunit [Salinibacillus xinjiangensis]